jgi:hypothetical protein
MRFLPIVFAMAIMQVFMALHADKNEDKAEELAQEMHTIASRCKKESLEQMMEERSRLLTRNENETVTVFVDAVERKIDGYDIIAYLRSFNTEVCTQCAGVMIADHELGRDAMWWKLGGQKIKTAKRIGVLKY